MLRNQITIFGAVSCLVWLGFAAQAQQGNPPAPALSVRAFDNQSVRLAWPSSATNFVLEATEQLGSQLLWQPIAQPPVLGGEEFSVTFDAGGIARFFRLLQASLTTIAQSSPADGETGVAVTRETVFDFTQPLATNAVLGPNQLYATFGGRQILSRLEMSADRRTVTLFYLEPLPSSARVRVIFDVVGLQDFLGRPVDLDGDGQPGGVKFLDFDTLSTTPIAGTAIIGNVFASDPGAGTNFIDRPLGGVTITVDGMEETLRTITDSNGFFRLMPCPAGEFFVHIDGRTLVNVPAGIRYPDLAYYPFVGKAWNAVAGRTNNLAGGTGLIYLPLIAKDTLQPVSATVETLINFPAAILQEHPELDGVSITVPANALLAENGTRGGRVGIAPVPPDRLPGPLPPGLEMPLVITIQTDGPANFDRPVPVRFPNLPLPSTGQLLPPGAKTALMSFDHDTGRWEMVGPATISADGRFAETDPGVGVRQPGWHGVSPVAGGSGGPVGGSPPPCPNSGGSGGQSCTQNPAPAPLNGCGPQSAPQPLLDALGANNPNLAACASFQAACNAHDVGYYTCGRSQKSVDDQFLADMLAACNCTENPILRADCIANAWLYYTLVSNAGGSAYEDGQSEGCLCEDPPPPGCGPGPTGGGGGGPFPQGGAPQASPLGQIAPAAAGAAPSQPHQTGSPRPPGEVVFQLVPHRFAVLDHETGAIIQRGQAGSTGYAVNQLLLQPNHTYSLLLLQESTLQDGWAEFTTGPAGSTTQLPPIYIRKPYAFDRDFDGLSDQGEIVLGTDMNNPDSDGDGVNDGAEVIQGSDPLDGLPVVTGVIATSDTPGTALDVCAINNLAVMADAAAGVVVFNVANGQNPVRIAQVDTPGTAQRVACSGNLIAVADGSAGLAVIDITDPPSARIVHQVNLGGSAQAVVTAGGIAFVGLSSGQLISVDLANGTVLERVNAGAAIHDLSIEGDVLFVLINSQLRAYTFADGALEFIGGSTAPGFFAEGITGLRRLFVGGGHAYVTSYPGYDTYDVRNPAVMVRVGQAQDAGPNSFKQIVLNGSGLGVAAVGVNPRADGTHDVYLYDASNPGVTTALLTVLPTPGLARALSIYNGLAYVADGEAGLQVVNYLAYDNLGTNPTITLSTSFALISPTNGVAEEGKLMRATATVTDDVQVRNVEFYVDGVRTVTDGNFPFEHRFVTPIRTAEKTNFTLRAKATDTGGNFTWTDTVVVDLVPDATPPRVKRTFPNAGAIVGSVNLLLAYFSEPITAATLSSGAFTLQHSGVDGRLETGDDQLIQQGSLTYRDDLNAAFLSFTTSLAPGLYLAKVLPPIADRAGNVLSPAAAWQFWVVGGIDTDQDGIPDDIELALGLDPNRSSTLSDGILDGDRDPDGDGLANKWEILFGYDPRNPDSDGNSIPDGQEDPDNDRLTNLQELARLTNPANPDTDGDGWSDEAEVTGQGNPLDAHVGPRLFVSAAPPINALVTGPGQLQTATLGTVVASPPLAVLVPGAGPLDAVNLGTIVARPPVKLLVPGQGLLDAVAIGVVIARPPLNVLVPGQGPLDSFSLGTVAARPPVALLVPGLGVLDSINLGTVIAQPPVNLLVPGSGQTEAISSGTTLARPPISIQIAP